MPPSTGRRSSTRSITACRHAHRDLHAAASPSTTIRTCRRRSTTSTARARSSTRPAGCPEPDGIRAKDGVRLSFANSTTSGNHLREQVQQFLQQTFAEIGVEMTISNLPAAVMWGDFWLKSQFDTAIVGHHLSDRGRPRRHQPLAHRARSPRRAAAARTTAQYSNPEVDALLEKGARTFDPEERRAIYYRVQEIVRQRPAVPAAVCRTPTWSGARKGSRASSPTPTPAPNPGMPPAGTGRADQLPPPGRRGRGGGQSTDAVMTDGGLNARLPAQPALAEPRAAGDRLDHRVRRSEPACRAGRWRSSGSIPA